MLRKILLRPTLVLMVVLSVVLPSLPTSAAATVGGNGLRVTPVRSDITISPGQQQVVDVSVTNVQDSPASLQAVINDFTANPNESGAPVIIVAPNQYAPSHSLKRFAVPIANTINIAPGATVTVPVTIKVPVGAAGGGYFGLVRFAPAGSQSQSTKNLTLAGSVGSLILLTVPGNIVHKMSLASFDVRSNNEPRTLFFSNKNIDAVVRFQNEGNIQEEPFGKILVKRGKAELSSVEVNASNPRGNVLPDSIRLFSIPLKKVGSFGVFTVEGNFGYGPNGQLLSATTTFYVIPLIFIIIFIALVVVILFLVFGLPKLIRQYNRRVISKAARSQK